MVIFLFLRNIPATIIPSLSVPLSLIGALAIMYEFGFSLDNLSLMALTVATGFVVDDAIVVIENIARFLEKGDTSLRGGDEGLGADRLHHHLAHRLADRGADPAAVHGRRRRAAVPRIRDHARGDDRHFGRRLADAGADAVRQASAPARPRRRGERRAVLSGAHPLLRRDAARRARSSGRDAAGRARHVRADRLSLCDDPEGLLSDPGHRRHPGRDAGGRGDFLRPDGRPPAGARQGDPRRSGRRKPLLLHRRRRLERHAQFRPLPHQPEAAREAQGDRERDHPPPAEGDRERPRHLAVHAAGAGSLDRHRRQRDAISVHAREPGSRDARDLDAQGAGAPERRFRRSSTWRATCSRTAAR